MDSLRNQQWLQKCSSILPFTFHGGWFQQLLVVLAEVHSVMPWDSCLGWKEDRQVLSAAALGDLDFHQQPLFVGLPPRRLNQSSNSALTGAVHCQKNSGSSVSECIQENVLGLFLSLLKIMTLPIKISVQLRVMGGTMHWTPCSASGPYPWLRMGVTKSLKHGECPDSTLRDSNSDGWSKWQLRHWDFK